MTHTTNPALSGEEIDKLEALARAATPGPWEWASDWDRAAVYSTTHKVPQVSGGHIFKRVVCSGNQNNSGRWTAEHWSGSDWSDAKFIAAANPATIITLIAQARAARQAPRVDAGVQAATSPAGERLVPYTIALEAVKRIQGCAATYIEDHCKDGYPGQLGVRPQDVAKMWALEIHDIDAKPFLDEAIADAALAQTAPAVAADERAVEQARIAAYREAARIAKQFAADRPMVHEWPTPIMRGRFEGEQNASSNIARLILTRATVVAPTVPAGVPFAWIATDLDGRADVGITKEIAKRRAGEGCTEFIPLFDLGVPAAQAQQASAPRPTDDDLWDETLRDRDQYHEWADKLAEAIARHFGVDIGEHSNMNCPWAEALDAIEAAQPAGAGAPSDVAMRHSVSASKGERYEFTQDGLDAFAAELARQGAAPAQAEPVYMVWNESQHLYGGGWKCRSKEEFDAVTDEEKRMVLYRATAPAGVAQADDLAQKLAALSDEMDEKRKAEDNEYRERIYLGMRDAYDVAARMVRAAPTQPTAPAVTTAPEALKFAAKVVELYDYATMQGDYMIDSGDCAAILSALADYFSRAAIQASANNTGSDS